MKKIQKFEDLPAWQKARELTVNIYQITGSGGFARDAALRDQIRLASVGVMSSLAEGFDRGARVEFQHYLMNARGGCAEVRSQLFVARDASYIGPEAFNTLYMLTEETGNSINGLRATIARQIEQQCSNSPQPGEVNCPEPVRPELTSNPWP